MKSAVLERKGFTAPAYPNAATRPEQLHKLLDHLLVIASCGGIAAMLMFLAVLA